MMPDVHDRVFEAYVGDLGDNLMRKTKDRIHWIAKHIEGNTVLDVGCSQGILDVLLAREGKKITALDISEKAIEEAKKYIFNERADTKKNVEFIVSNFMFHDFKDKLYDNIVMAEVLEHLVNPEPFIKKASTLLKNNAKLIVTVPFGVNDFFDHKFTYYFYDIYSLLAKYLQVKEFKILGKWIAFIAEQSEVNNSEIILEKTMPLIEDAFHKIERELLNDTKILRDNLKKANEKYRESTQKVKQLSTDLLSTRGTYQASAEKVNQLSNDLSSIRGEYQASTEKVNQLSNDLSSTRERYQESTEKVSQLSNDLSSTREQYQESTEKVSQLSNDLSSIRERYQESTEKVNQLSNDLLSTRERYHESTEKVNQLFNDLSSMRERYQESAEKTNQLTKDLSAALEKYQESTEKVNQLSNDILSINEKNNESISLRIQEKEKVLDELKVKMEHLRLEILEKNTMIIDLKDKNMQQQSIAQEKLNKLSNTMSYRLGYTIVHIFKSKHNFLSFPKNILKIFKDQKLKKKEPSKPSNKTKVMDLKQSHEALKDGISIITPSYRGEDYIQNLLSSIAEQDFPRDKFEHIFILNGAKDKTELIINDFIKKEKNISIKILNSGTASASIARNMGIKCASFRYITLIDADDAISRNFLSSLFVHASLNNVVISQIIDVDEQGQLNELNPINSVLLNYGRAEKKTFNLLSRVLTINACKLIPSIYMKDVSFEKTLKSGEDIVYFSTLFMDYKPAFIFEKQAIYYRHLKSNSISRQSLSYEFSIVQRLSVIKQLDILLRDSTDENFHHFLKNKIHAQIGFMNRYLIAFRQEYSKAIDDIKSLGIIYFPYQLLNRNLSQNLVISYCFTPFVDTSAIVMAKRIYAENSVVDVIYNDMNVVREANYTLNLLADNLIDNKFEIKTNSSFSNWQAIELFAKEAIKKIIGKNYRTVYSRSMWPASHFAAFELKITHPHIEWTAEFSDPILFDIHANMRKSKINNREYLNRLTNYLKNKKIAVVSDDNLFFWCEYLTYLFADKLVFTNENQFNYMLDSFPIKLPKEEIRKKSIISQHPTLPIQYYSLIESSYYIAPKKINFAYFGTFYQTRKLNDIISAVERLNAEYRNKILIHVFTNEQDDLIREVSLNGVQDFFKINQYVGYFEFLNITLKMDCLILNDAITKPSKSLNPYLPSKLSDYIGSGKPIWALCEHNSILSQSKAVQYKSFIGEDEQNTLMIKKIIDDLSIPSRVIKTASIRVRKQSAHQEVISQELEVIQK